MKANVDYEVRHRDPEDVTLGSTDTARLLSEGSAGTPSSVFRVYDATAGKETTIDATEAASQTVLSVADPGTFLVGEDAEVEETDGTFLRANVDSISTVNGTITLASALVVGAAVGARVRRILGTGTYTVTMSGYGTAAIGSLEWGWKATLPGSYAGLKAGLKVRIEIDFTGAAAGGLDDYAIICETVEEECEDGS